MLLLAAGARAGGLADTGSAAEGSGLTAGCGAGTAAASATTPAGADTAALARGIAGEDVSTVPRGSDASSAGSSSGMPSAAAAAGVVGAGGASATDRARFAGCAAGATASVTGRSSSTFSAVTGGAPAAGASAGDGMGSSALLLLTTAMVVSVFTVSPPGAGCAKGSMDSGWANRDASSNSAKYMRRSRPTPIWSPWRSVWLSTRRPLTRVPLVLLRSSTVAEPGSTRISACSALMPGCLMRTSQRLLRPIRFCSAMSGNSTIVLSGCNQKSFAMVLRYFLSAGFLRNFCHHRSAIGGSPTRTMMTEILSRPPLAFAASISRLV